MIRIAITKGRIEKQVCELLNKAGISTDVIDKKDRKLLVKDSKEDIEIEYIFVKANDIITLLKYGKIDVGFVGKDTLIESRFKDYYELLDLNVGKCMFALASYPNFKKREFKTKKVIATKYPNITRNFFSNKGEDIDIIKLEGSVELGPIIEVSDAIVDIVETGTTLKANGLEVIEKIEDISTRMVVNKASLKTREKNIDIFKLLDKLEEVV